MAQHTRYTVHAVIDHRVEEVNEQFWESLVWDLMRFLGLVERGGEGVVVAGRWRRWLIEGCPMRL